MVTQVVMFYGVRWLIRQMDPMRKKKDDAALQAKSTFSRLGLDPGKLNEYEQVIASEIIHSDDIHVRFHDIGGLEDIVSALEETVIYPLTMPHLFNQGNQLLGPPKGVLLYGPPGNGKTMLAKALAKESNAVFINLHLSTLTEKWYGESQKLVRALFSLARKLQPSIIFIDEIDAFLRERTSSDHEVTGMMKAEFMSLWDGLQTTGSDRIIILGATNRYHDIDKAILRRMPKRFPVNLPSLTQRVTILSILLQKTNVKNKEETIKKVANMTNGFSGSDLKESCRNAVMVPVREQLKNIKSRSQEQIQIENEAIQETRPLELSDFAHAVELMDCPAISPSSYVSGEDEYD